MMEYELINPSDKYTFVAPDLEVAALTVFTLSFSYGAEPKDNGEDVPIFIFGGADKWYEEKFGRKFEDGIALRKGELADALRSMMLGGFEDRERYNAALEAITDDEKRADFISKWQDGRSSLSDIGTHAHKIGSMLKEG